uniref:Zinc knuckle CX2CX4HX4C domain-containing protein n=1 Tax=Cannabis sativa TaxID=3483 RepID=A0A803PJT7_CANSA
MHRTAPTQLFVNHAQVFAGYKKKELNVGDLVTAANCRRAKLILESHFVDDFNYADLRLVEFDNRLYNSGNYLLLEVSSRLCSGTLYLISAAPPFVHLMLAQTIYPFYSSQNPFRSIPDPKWISFKFENLPNFCYFCGLLDHTYNRFPKNLLCCDNFPSPPILEYRDSLWASTHAHLKKNPFEISNSTPFQELFPRHCTPGHSLQHVVNKFLRMDTPSSRTVTSSAPFTTIPMSFSQQIPSSTIPPPIITTSIITHTTKGKGIALPTSSPPHSPCTRPTGLVINEPRSQSSPASSVGTRRHYTRQSAQVGDSVRSMLKRARAVPSDDAVVPSLSDDEQTAGVASRPRREK